MGDLPSLILRAWGHGQTHGDPGGPAEPCWRPGHRARDVVGFLAWRLVRTGRETERALTDTIDEHDLTNHSVRVLSLLVAGANFSPSDHARRPLVLPDPVSPARCAPPHPIVVAS